MQKWIIGAIVGAGVLLSMAFAVNANPPAFPISRANLTLDRAVSLAVTINAPTNYVVPTTTTEGFVVTQMWLEPWMNHTNAEGQSTLGVKISTGPFNYRTVVFAPERFNTSSGTRSNGRDRVISFDPPFVVKPGDTLTIEPLIHDQSSLSWGAPPAGTTPFNVGLGCYRVCQGEV